MSDQGESLFDFGAMVAFYERVVDPLTLPVGRRVLELIDLKDGEDLIDVAAGTGALAVEAARRGTRILAVDLAPEMVARAAEKLKPFVGCEARLSSFDALDLADASFDAALSLFGVLAFPEGRRGLRELVRVARPGGRVAVADWDQERPATPQHLAFDVFAQVFPGHRLWPEDFFPSWTKDEVATALRATGCGRTEVYEVEGEWRVTKPSDVMKDSGDSLRMFPGYKSLDDAGRARFEQAFVAAVTQRADADGVARLPTRAFVVVGHPTS